jgi:hypothetical protein
VVGALGRQQPRTLTVWGVGRGNDSKLQTGTEALGASSRFQAVHEPQPGVKVL